MQCVGPGMTLLFQAGTCPGSEAIGCSCPLCLVSELHSRMPSGLRLCLAFQMASGLSTTGPRNVWTIPHLLPKVDAQHLSLLLLAV